MILSIGVEKYFRSFLATKEVLEPLANDPIMLGRSIRFFSHLKYQSPSIILDHIDWRRGGETIRKQKGGTTERRNGRME